MPVNIGLKKPLPPETRGKQQQKFIAGIVYDLIAESGIENLTMRQVAEAAQVSLGTVTYHFSSKEKLITAALELGYESLARFPEEVAPRPDIVFEMASSLSLRLITSSKLAEVLERSDIC